MKPEINPKPVIFGILLIFLRISQSIPSLRGLVLVPWWRGGNARPPSRTNATPRDDKRLIFLQHINHISLVGPKPSLWFRYS